MLRGPESLKRRRRVSLLFSSVLRCTDTSPATGSSGGFASNSVRVFLHSLRLNGFFCICLVICLFVVWLVVLLFNIFLLLVCWFQLCCSPLKVDIAEGDAQVQAKQTEIQTDAEVETDSGYRCSQRKR